MYIWYMYIWYMYIWYTFESVRNGCSNTWGKNTFLPGQFLYAAANEAKNWVFCIHISREKASELWEHLASADLQAIL